MPEFFSPDITYNIEDFITSGKSVILTYSNLSLIKKLGDIEYPILNVIHDYMQDIKDSSLVLTAKMTDEEMLRYQFRPKLLSYDIYGTTDLYFFILALNGMCDVKDFNKKKIKMIRKKDLSQLLTWIYNSEKTLIDKYNNS